MKPFRIRRCLRAINNFIILYFDNCCIHGFRYVVQAVLMFFER